MPEVPEYRITKDGHDFIPECWLPPEVDLMEKNVVERLATNRDEEIRANSGISEHLATLLFITVETNAKRILELGLGWGNSTTAFLYGLKQTGGFLTSIDYDECERTRERIRNDGLDSNWKFLRGDDMDIDFGEELDILFIDSSHQYKHTKNELEKYEPNVKNGGFIILHDTVMFPGVTKAVDEFITSHPKYIRYRWFNNCGLQVIKKVLT